jgi:transcription initiation factor TFIID TATA-box-binding protein
MTISARSVADVQAAIEHIYPLVYEFKKARATEITEDVFVEARIDSDVEDHDIDEDDSDDDDEEVFDPLEDPLEIESSPPPMKKQKLRDVSHLTKRYKGPSKCRGGGTKRPLGKMNEPKHDMMNVSDGEIDADDF